MWRTCPRKLYLSAVKKLVEPPNANMERGSHIHKLAEKFVKGELPELPAELKLYEKMFTALKAKRAEDPTKVHVEKEWAFTKNWKPCSWFDKQAWCRIKTDIAYNHGDVLHICDYKTGQMRAQEKEKYAKQLKLYALGAFLMLPDDTIMPRLAFIDHGQDHPGDADEDIVVRRDELDGLKAQWEADVAPMLADTEFKPTPNWSCNRFCYYKGKHCAAG